MSGLLDFSKVRQAIKFADVLAHYDLTPEKSGNQIKIHCPFHDDSTPSLSINLEKGIFKCFGCGAEGNVLDFIAQMENFTENPTFSAARHGLEIMGLDQASFTKDGNGAETPKNARRASKRGKTANGTAPAAKTPQTASQPVSEDVTPPPTQNEVIDLELKLDPTHSFLATRGISPEVATTFGMGFCTRGLMRNRIAIPIHNAAGELVAFTGRWALESDPPENENKYKLPKGFHKGLELYNLHRALAFEKRYVVVVEGIWSVLRLHQAGIPAVALFGTSCSAVQAELLGQHYRHAVVILDGDEAGQKAAPVVVHALSQHVYVRTITLADGVKPDTMDETLLHRLQR